MIVFSDIWYQINESILTVYYEVTKEDAIGTNNDIAVINIDLENKKVIFDEELLNMVVIVLW